MIFQDWLEEWLQDKKNEVKPATYSSYLLAIENHLIPILGGYEIGEINSAVLQEAVNKWAKEGNIKTNQPLSSKSIRENYGLATRALKAYCEKNQMPIITYKVKLPPKDNFDIETFTKEEQKKIILKINLACAGKRVKYACKCVGIGLGLCAGLRIGEVCAITWGNIDFENRTILVDSTAQRISGKKGEGSEIVIGNPKTSNGFRTIPFNATIEFFLLSLYELCNHPGKDIYIVTNSNKCTEPRTYESTYKTFLRKAGVKTRKFHCLRHSFATKAIACRMDYKTLSKLLGHSDIKTTLALYVHPQLEDKRVAMELMDNFI